MKVSLPYFNYNYTSKAQEKNHPAFGHHRDFEEIKKKRPICYSYYFRRDYISQGGNGFYDIVSLFRKVFTGKGEPKKMLIAGIANSEEPFSYLATIKQLNPNKPIEDVLDLHIIDLQSKPDETKLYGDSYILDIIPEYAKNSFIFKPHPKYALFDYRVNDELLDFARKTYNDPAKSKWETRLQEASYPKNYFDVISVNNVLYYIPQPDMLPTYDKLCKSLKQYGYIITEDDKYAQQCTSKYDLYPQAPGIHQKLDEEKIWDLYI